MNSDFSSIKSEFEKDKKDKQVELVQLKTQEEETELSKMFAKQSEKLRSEINNK